jgi:hypothetical protein
MPSPTSIETEIHDRALRFAATLRWINPRIVKSTAARDEFVTRFGTPGAAEYREIEIHMDCQPELFEELDSVPLKDRAVVEMYLKAGTDLLVVCSSTDIIHHEFIRTDLD